MNPYRVLGLNGDATESEIKRAYARLLKEHRPDSDPQGFQRVHEAYTHCLAHARDRAEYGPDRYDEDEDEVEEHHCETAIAEPRAVIAHFSSEDALSHTDPADAAGSPKLGPMHAWLPATETETQTEDPLESETQKAAFNIDEFVDELMQRACTQLASDLTQWLHGHEALYSLQLKQFLGAPVADALARSEQLPADENVGAMLTFFGLNTVGQQHPWVTHSLQVAWERLQDRREFERVRKQHNSPITTPVDRMLWRELVSSRHWLRFMMILLCPSLPSRTRSLLLTLEQLAPREAQAKAMTASARFWRLAADRDRLDWRRWLVILLRLPLILPVAAFVGLVSETGFTPRGLAIIGSSMLGLWFASAVATIGWRRLLRYNQERLHWDIPLAAACFMLALALLSGLAHPGLIAALLCGLTLVFWFVQRNGESYWVGTLAALTGGALVVRLGMVTAPAGSSVGARWWILAGVYATASVIAHDVLYARIHHETVLWARGQLGWLGWLLVVHSILIVIVTIAAAARAA